MKTKKWKICLLTFCALLLFAIPSAIAFLLDSDGAVNNFSVGENTSHIEENFGSYESFKSGQSYEKEVVVVNDGSVDCYVRVFAEIEDPDVAAGIDIDFNTADWTEKQEDGFYYYRKSISPGEKTSPLFTILTATEDTDEFQMICYSETVQAAGAADSISAFSAVK